MKQINRQAPVYWIVLASFFLLTWQWDAHGLWDDELFTIRLAQLPTLSDLVAGTILDFHPPLHYVLIRGWIMLAGHTDYAIRFSSIAFALLAIALAFRIGAQLLNRTAAQWAMLLLGISPFLILYARMARYYSFAMMLGLLSLWLFILLSRDAERQRLRWAIWLMWITVAVTLLYTDYPTSIILVGENIFLLIYWRRFRFMLARWIVAQIIALVGFAPWVGIVLTQIKQVNTAFGDIEFARGFFGMLFKIGQPMYSFIIGETLMPWHPAAIIGLLAGAILFAAGAREIIARRYWKYIFIVLFLILPLVYLVSVSFTVAYAFPSRVMVALPFLYLLFALGAQKMRWGKFALAGLGVAFLFGLGNYYPG